MIAILFYGFIGAMIIAFAYVSSCPRRRFLPHERKLISLGWWGATELIEAEWECQHCHAERREFGISQSTVARWFPDFGKVKDALYMNWDFGISENEIEKLKSIQLAKEVKDG